jgi:hypothetical protein
VQQLLSTSITLTTTTVLITVGGTTTLSLVMYETTKTFFTSPQITPRLSDFTATVSETSYLVRAGPGQSATFTSIFNLSFTSTATFSRIVPP